MKPNADDCFECKAIGTATFGGCSAYMYSLFREIPKGTRKWDRVFYSTLSVGFASLAGWRWFCFK